MKRGTSFIFSPCQVLSPDTFPAVSDIITRYSVKLITHPLYLSMETSSHTYNPHRYRFNGKEWVTQGLPSHYDYGGRVYEPAVTVDSLDGQRWFQLITPDTAEIFVHV